MKALGPRPGPLAMFALAFTLLLAAAVCVGVGNFRPNTTLLPVISFYLSGAAVLFTAIALLLRTPGSSGREPPER